MSHHYSGPDFGFPHGDARLDLTDLYAFPKPGDAGKSILIMNVHPSSGFNPPEPTTADPFATEALYELKIDTNGDAVADTTCSSPATISSLTKTCAASFSKYPTLLWGRRIFACGRARLRQVMAALGSKQSAERVLRKRSCLSKSEMPTSRVNRPTMGVSFLPSPTLWSTRVDIRRLRRCG
jgi:Domain of unknown function (DUF4331)